MFEQSARAEQRKIRDQFASGGAGAGWGRPLVVLAGLLSFGACAKSPTVISTRVVAEPGVPPLRVLRTTVAASADPTVKATSSFVSVAPGDGDLPAPYVFPFDVPISVPTALAGAVTLTIEGLDYETAKIVLARGTTEAEAVTEKETQAALTLTPVVGGTDGQSDGGADGSPDGSDNGGGVPDDASGQP